MKRDLAHNELCKNQNTQKAYYNRRAVPQTLKSGDLVLLLLPTDHNKLLMHWRRPFEVTKKKNENDYLIWLRPNKEKLFHINMPKQYHNW